MTVDDTEKHKPSERHTLDEVLKSLQDLIRNDLLEEDRPPPPPKPPVDPSVPRRRGRPRKEPTPEPEATEPPRAASQSDLALVLSSLNELVANELGPEQGSAAMPQADTTETQGDALPEALEASLAASEDGSPSPDDVVAAESELDVLASLAAEAPAEAKPQADTQTEALLDVLGQAPAGAPTIPPAPDAQQVLAFDFETPRFPNTTPSSELPETDDNLVAWDSGHSPAQAPDDAHTFESGDRPALGELTAERPPERDYELSEPALASDSDVPTEDALAADAGGGLGASVEPGETPDAPEPPTVPFATAAEPAAAQLEPPRGETAAFDFDDIPVLEDAIEHPHEHIVPPATIAHVLESPKLRQLAIRVVARLNIELRRGNERPLKARTVDRLQQILREELEALETNVENKRPK
jgi:hypothetical protein